jgi:outer membrane protein TolC
MVTKIICTLLTVTLVIISTATAEDLRSAVTKVVKTDSRIKAADATLEAAVLNKKVAFGEMLPTVELEAEYGSGEFDRDWDDDTNKTSFEQTNLRLVQPFTAFGVERAGYRRSKLSVARSASDRNGVKQDLILESLTSYLRLKQAEQVVAYAKNSVANIQKQTDMEDARVKKGQGVSTDVLQAKTQLLRAQARLTLAEGMLIGAQNTAQRVFSRPASIISSLTKVSLASGKAVPSNLRAAEVSAIASSPELKSSTLASNIAKETLSSVKYDKYMPKVNGVLQADWKDDFGGVEGDRTEQIAKIEVIYTFNVGLSDVNGTKAARQKLIASEQRLIDARKRVLLRVRNAWQNLNTAKQTSELFRSQVELATQFLDLARKERKRGKRSLLDLLSGETTLINAQSEAASAEADVEVYTYELMRAAGMLNVVR